MTCSYSRKVSLKKLNFLKRLLTYSKFLSLSLLQLLGFAPIFCKLWKGKEAIRKAKHQASD